jgi:putative addiction module component (TIGR02574 family)
MSGKRLDSCAMAACASELLAACYRVWETLPMSSRPPVDIETLSRDERLDLLERLWESLSDDPNGIPLTDEQRAELEGRLDRLDADGPTGIPWDKIRAEMNRS